MDPRPDLAASLVAAARSMSSKDTLEETLSAIAQTARISVPDIDHVGISTIDRKGRIITRAATDSVVRELDDLQYGLQEGPCVDVLHEHRVVAEPRIRHEQRWPRYVPEAVRRTGLKSQLAVQLSLDGEGTLGGLNLYSTTHEDLDPEATSIAELFAAQAAIALGRVIKITTLNEALQSRKVIGQAVGILMERYEMNEERAFAFLVRASSNGNIKLRDVAQELVDSGNRRQKDGKQ
jgi:GAF domain-containing protein